MEINHYKLNPNVTIEKLEEIGFRPGGWMPNIKEPKMMYMSLLYKEIELFIEINTNTFEFDDYENVFVFDDDYGQAYYPFYHDQAEFDYALKVKRAYNDKMDSLVDEGLLNKVNVKTKKKTI